MIEIRPNELASAEELVMRHEHIAAGTVRVKSVMVAVVEEREAQEEVFQQFSRMVLGNSSDSSKVSNSEDENKIAVPSDTDEEGIVQATASDGFQIVHNEAPTDDSLREFAIGARLYTMKTPVTSYVPCAVKL
jgi:hypothetical protein